MTKKLWAGLDVGVESTSLCIIGSDGDVVHQATCPTSVEAIHREIRWIRRVRHKHVGLEASGGANLARALRNLGYSVGLYETLQLSKFLAVRRNKTDQNDARGIADAGRLGGSLISKVYLKSLECQSLQSRLVIRRHLIRERVAAVCLLCRQIELYGGRIRRSSTSTLRLQVEAEIKRLFGRSSSQIAADLLGLLGQCERLIKDQQKLDRELRQLALDIDICRRFMEIPGVGPFCALTFYATVGDPHRFQRSANVGAYFGLAPRLRQSGLTTRPDRISKMGNSAMRSLLVQSALIFMRTKQVDPELKNWAQGVERRRGRGRARIALARKLAVIMLAMWRKDVPYRPAVDCESSGEALHEQSSSAPTAKAGNPDMHPLDFVESVVIT
jgi:transposase